MSLANTEQQQNQERCLSKLEGGRPASRKFVISSLRMHQDMRTCLLAQAHTYTLNKQILKTDEAASVGTDL